MDTVLIHWLTSSAASSDPACTGPAANATECRLQTWRALVTVFKSGAAKSIGVSNYDAVQLMEIEAAGLPLPAINQIPLHIYRSSSHAETIDYCMRKGIVVNSYSPFGVPDWCVFR